MPNDQTLYDFQRESVDWLKSTRDNQYGFVCLPFHGLIGHEMGLGKTAIGLATVRELIESGKRGLFLVPGATIIQWQRQYDRWILDNEPDEFGTTSLVAIRSTKQAVPRDISCIMSHSLLARTEIIPKLATANFDFIVIDEIHKFGSQGTKRIKHLWALINLSQSHFESGRIALSGTPVRNYAKEIYNVAHFLSSETPAFRHYDGPTGFKQRYLTYDGKALYNPNQFHRDFLPFYIRRTVSEVMKDLPPIRRTKLYTEITDPFVIKAYNAQLDLMSNFERNAEKLDTFSMLGFLIRLRHITGIAKAKEPAIIEPIRDYILGENGEDTQRKVVLGIHHHFVTGRLKKSLTEFPHFLIRGGMDGFEKERVKEAFIKHKGGAILQLSIKAAGEGIDGLQYSGARKIITFERQWNSRDEEQFEKRIHRTGQIYSVDAEQTIAIGTVDEFYDALCEEKLKYTTQVEDTNWARNPAFLRTLWEKALSNRLPSSQIKTYEDDDNPLESIYNKPSLAYPMSVEQEMNSILSGDDYVGE